MPRKFRKKKDRIGTQIGNIVVTLTDRVEEPDETGQQQRVKGGTVTIRVLDTSGELTDRVHVNLEPHLNPPDLQWLSDFLDRIRTQAEQEILGP